MNCCRPVNNNAGTHTGSSDDDDSDSSIIIIPDNYNHPSTNEKIVYPKLYENHFESLLIPYSIIHQRTKQIANSILQHYYTNSTQQQEEPQEPLVIICILKGSNPFYNLLLSELSLLSVPYILEFIRVKSYVGNSSSGNVQIFNHNSSNPNANSNENVPKSVKGRNVILVEDIVDTGMTLSKLLPIVQEYGQPKSLQVCTLLIKRLPSDNHNDDMTRSNGGKIVPKFIGFSIPDKFVVGFGLDYNEMYRDLRDIWVLGKVGIELGGYGDM